MPLVRAYVRALDRHDPRAACATLAPAARRQLHGFQEPTCVAAVREAFKLGDAWRGSRLLRAGLLRVNGRSWNALTGVETVTSTVTEDFGCQGAGPSERRCRPATRRREDVVYLIHRGTGWAIVKPGILLRTFEIGQRGAPEQALYLPPGNAATVAAPAQIAPPTFACTGSPVSASDPVGDGRRQDGYSRAEAPWLDITGLTISRPNDRSLCFAIALRATLRAASSVRIFTAPASEPETYELVQIRVDALGFPHVLVGGRAALPDPGFRSALEEIGLAGTSLEVLVPTPGLGSHVPAFVTRVVAESAQGGEPLLEKPVSAEDVAPNEACLEYPSGKLVKGACGTEPSG